MKIGIVYTSTTPELIETVERELRAVIGDEAEFLSFEDPAILAETRENGAVTAQAAARLAGLFVGAINAGADVIYNCCSSVGEVADSLQDFARYTGVPIVRIDGEMCREAVRIGGRVAVMATLATTLEPTAGTIKRAARELGKRVEIKEALVEGAFGLSQSEFRAKMLEKAATLKGNADCIVLAQGSMAYCEKDIAEACGVLVLSSPRFGAPAVRRAVEAKGLLECVLKQ